MNHTNTIQHILSTWGRLSREIPLHNEKLKSEALARLIVVSPVHISRWTLNSFPWASLALAGFALLAVLIMPTRIDHVLSPESITNRESAINTLNTQKQSTQIDQYVLSPESAINDGSATEVHTREGTTGGFTQKKSMQAQPADSARSNILEYAPSPNAIEEISITDTREYLKTDYRAAIRTRRVQELAQRIRTAVRGFGGRVDGLNSSPKYGLINFVIPASQFDAFQDEIKDIAGKRFLIENIYTENFLPQKQSIEQNQEGAKKTLAQLNADRGGLIATHSRVLAAIQSELGVYVYELDQLKREVTNDALRKAQIAVRIQELLKEEKIVNARLQNENANYGRNLQSLDAKIRYEKNNLEFLDTQDQELLNTVATVRGTISLDWISLWQVTNLYIPFPWIPILLMGAAIITYIMDRRRNRLIIS